MSELLVLAVLASFLLRVVPSLDQGMFLLAVTVLALGAGLGGAPLLRGPLGAAGIVVWYLESNAAYPGLIWIYSALFGVLIVTFLFGRLLSISAWAFPAAFVLAMVGIGALISAFL